MVGSNRGLQSSAVVRVVVGGLALMFLSGCAASSSVKATPEYCLTPDHVKLVKKQQDGQGFLEREGKITAGRVVGGAASGLIDQVPIIGGGLFSSAVENIAGGAGGFQEAPSKMRANEIRGNNPDCNDESYKQYNLKPMPTNVLEKKLAGIE